MPIISAGALKRMTTLGGEHDKADNVLLEHLLALQLARPRTPLQTHHLHRTQKP